MKLYVSRGVLKFKHLALELLALEMTIFIKRSTAVLRRWWV